MKYNDKAKEEIVNWSNIFILIDFQYYLNQKELILIGALSKSTRTKLFPIIFKKLFLSNYHFISKSIDVSYVHSDIDIIMNFYKFRNSCRKYKPSKETLPLYSNLDIGFLVNGFIKVFQVYASYAKSITFKNIQDPCIYTFPIVKIFSNLTVLNLSLCFITLDEFAKLGKSLVNLIELYVINVDLFESNNNIVSEDSIILPHTIRKLSIIRSYKYTISGTFNPAKFLFEDHEVIEGREFCLSQVAMPFLLELNLKYLESNYNNYINQFLNSNPQLEAYNISFEYLNQSIISSIFNLKSTKSLTFECSHRSQFQLDNLIIPTLPTVEYLKFDCACKASEAFLQRFLLACPNLNRLILAFEPASDCTNIPELLNFIKNNLKKLKNFEIEVFDNDIVDIYKLSSDSNIELLKIRYKDAAPTVIDFCLINSKLKKIQIYYNPSNECPSLLGTFELPTGWKFIDNKKVLTCIKLKS